jgi:N-sulfoglucosamine sulfohydrolase
MAMNSAIAQGSGISRRAFLFASALAARAALPRPNILWITCEDTSPDLGCYGDAYSRTPNLDAFAREGVRYTNAFTVAGVCAPSRSGIITGMYPSSIGTHHMRSEAVPPSMVRCFPEFLRAAGYYCTNNAKTDYNFESPRTAWDQSGRHAHWRNRAPGQPFFAVFNILTTHESNIRATPAAFAKLTAAVRDQDRHDPAQATVPPYYPDTPVVRRDIANYYDLVTAMDVEVGRFLRELQEDGLGGNTVVFFYGDHGRGLTRCKYWIYDSGIHIPLLVRWPGVLAPGTVETRMVSGVDFGPTVLSIAGIRTPAHMQGRAFLGQHAAEPRQYVFAARDRIDETYDVIRCVRDSRYKYIRNYQPCKPYAQYMYDMDRMPTMQEMRRLQFEAWIRQKRLEGPVSLFFAPEKPKEELYDTQSDPHEIRNLAADPEHRGALERLRDVHEHWMKEIGDQGLIPESELRERMRPGGRWQTTEAPVVRPAGGRFPGPVQVRIACATEGSSIAYTTGAGPEARWRLYTGEFTVAAGATLRAVACRLGYRESAEATAEFRIG